MGYGDTGSAARFFYCAKVSRTERNKGCEALPFEWTAGAQPSGNRTGDPQPIPGTSSTRGTTSGNRGNFHPTVKPIALMRYLVRLATPPGGTVLDPFTGSGSTGIACKLEGFNFIGCERDPEYIDIARARIDAWQPEPEVPKQGDLFA